MNPLETCCKTIYKEILRTAKLIFSDDNFKNKLNKKIISSSYKFDASNYVEEKILNKPGVYVFVFKNSCNIDVEEFNNYKYSSKIHTDEKNMEIVANKVLYIGKAKNLRTRFANHFDSIDKEPYSLHLNLENRKSVIPSLEVRCYYIKRSLKFYYNIIARQLEKAVAEKYNKELLITNR